jgi:hypothetical protein
MSNLVKISKLEAELFHVDGRMDGRKDRQADRQSDRQRYMAKIIVAFRSYEIEQYGTKRIITCKSTISSAEYVLCCSDKGLNDQKLKHLAVTSLDW